MKVADFDYHLLSELIAQEPLKERDASRLMVVDRQKETITHAHFLDILSYLKAQDCMVVNDARVLPARLVGKKQGTGGRVEFLLLSELETGKWEALVKPGRRLPAGTAVSFGGGLLNAVVEKRISGGRRLVAFSYEGSFDQVLARLGKIPLPPYIRKDIRRPERYQTVYAKSNGAVAAPTAGLHFTDRLLGEVEKRDVKRVAVTLDVGLDSFRPVRVQEVEEHKMHSERFSINKESAIQVNETIENRGRVLAVGTTTARVLESAVVASQDGCMRIKAISGKTDLFIYPGYEFRIVDALLTNFHLPRSTLLMLVCAFASVDLIKEAYRRAVEKQYRFFSFGDAMLIV